MEAHHETIFFLCVFAIAVCPQQASAYPVEVGASYDGHINGDVTGEGLVTAEDATLIAEYYVGLRTELPGDDWPNAADVDNDGVISIVDALMVSQHVGEFTGTADKLLDVGTTPTLPFLYTYIQNQTTKVWTEFHFYIEPFSSEWFVNPTSSAVFQSDPPDPAYDGPGEFTISDDGLFITVTGINIGVGDVYSPSLNVVSEIGSWGVYGGPGALVTPVPEPATMLLLGSGLLGLAGLRRRFKR